MDREGLGPASTSRESGIELRAEGVEGIEQSVELWEIICVCMCKKPENCWSRLERDGEGEQGLGSGREFVVHEGSEKGLAPENHVLNLVK